MKRWFYWLGMFHLGFLAPLVHGAGKTQARLVLAVDSAHPGQTVMAGIQLTMAPGWHTYWRNPGDSGAPPQVQWSLPPGIAAGDLQWPVPEKLTEAGLTTYVYYREVLLLVSLTLASNLPLGNLELKGQVSWLECAQLCVPGRAEVKAKLVVAKDSTNSPEAALIRAWQGRLPKPEAGLAARAWWPQAPSGDTRPVLIEWATTAPPDSLDFFPYASPDYEVQPSTQHIRAGTAKVRLEKAVKKFADGWPAQLAGLLVVTAGKTNPPAGYEVNLPIGPPVEGQKALGAPATGALSEAPPPRQSFFVMLGLGFLGGLILNIMPCVLPVIALKILGFVNQSGESPRQVRKLGWIYAAGVQVSFLALAGLVIGVKAAGHKAGWGMQFGNPQFLIVLTVLVTLVALNLFGVFEINLSGKVMGAAGQLVIKEGWAGAFFNGVLATALATPCTAPFLGAALGYAFLQPPPVIILMFLVVGLGLAAPYVILSMQPAWLRFLPKPGRWMDRFKVAMGFPMLATAVWLFTLTPLHYGRRVWWLGLFLVMVALVAWIYGEFVQRGRRHKEWAAAVALALAVVSYTYGLEDQLRWRSPDPPASRGTALKASPEGIQWQRWSPAEVAQAQAAGRPILVDFTADWCLTCQVNMKTSLDIPSVRAKLKETGALALLGDYTTVPDDITVELNRFGRAGVPLVLVYSRQTSRPPVVLPEILTPETVLHALDQAAR